MDFAARLPSALLPETPSRGHALQLKASGPLRILVFNENQAAADMLLALLQVQGYEVEAVCDGKIALDTARRSRADIIIIDICFPKME